MPYRASRAGQDDVTVCFHVCLMNLPRTKLAAVVGHVGPSDLLSFPHDGGTVLDDELHLYMF